MRSVSCPLATSQAWAKEWRNWCGWKLRSPAARPIAYHLVDAAPRDRPGAPQQQRVRAFLLVRQPHPQIAVQRLDQLAAQRQQALAAALPKHPQEALVEVQVVNAHRRHFATAHASVDQQQ